MSTAEEGGAKGTNTANPSSSYGGGGGGAGGKFRRKPFRRQATPYDRPSIANRSNSGWLKKLVVDPASKLISYGARRFFDSLLRKRIPPPPPPPQKLEPNHVMNDGIPEAVLSDPVGVECSLPISSDRNSISDIEQMLKHKTFTRTEIDHLSELLHSRAGEVSLRDDRKRNEETVSDFGRHQQIVRGPVEENRNKGPHEVVSTPISDSKVIEGSIASPAELAKSYMGSRSSKLSPLALVNHSQVTTEGNKLISNMRNASKPVSSPFTMNTLVGSGSLENGYTTKPISFRRSAIYNMSRAPYSKRTGINHNGCTGLPMSSTSLSVLENCAISESKSMTLKRRSFVLDDVGSGGPIRRIRQKSNLIATGAPHSDRSNPGAIQIASKQKLSLIGAPMHVLRTEENANISIPSTSYAVVPFESNDVEDNSSEPRVLAGGKKSPFKLTSSMLQGKALRSMEDATSSKLLLNVQDDRMCESSAGLLDTRDFHQGQGEDDENGPVETSAPPGTSFPRPIIDNDSAVSFKASLVRDVENGPSQPKNGAAFRMSALEDYVDLDDDLPCNGFPSHPLSERRGPEATHFTDSKFSPPEEPKVLESTIKPELKSASDLMSSKTNEISSAVAVSLRDRSSGIIPPASEEVTAALATIPPLSVPALDKPKEINNPPSVFSFSSKVADNFPSSRTPEGSSSLPDDSSLPSSLVKLVEPKNGGYLKPLAAEDISGKFDTPSTAASNGPSSSNINTHQISTATPAIFTPSVSVSVNIPSGAGSISSAASSAIIFGAAEMPKASAGTFSFGASPDPFTKASSVSTTVTSAEDLKNNVPTDPSSGIPSSTPTTFVAFGASSSGNVTSGLGSSTGNPAANNSQGSLFGSAIKSFAPAVGTDSQGTSAQSLTFASQPSSDTNSSTSLVSSLTSSQPLSSTMSFGFNSSTLNAGSTSSLFGVNPSAVAEGSTGGSSSFTTTSMFSFGVVSATCSSTNAIGSTAAATVPSFGFGASSTSSTNATGSTAAPTVPSFGFGLSTTSSSTSLIGSTGAATLPGFSFGASSTTSSTYAIGSTSAATVPSFSFGVSSSGSAPVTTSPFSSSSFSASALGSTSGATPSIFNFGASASASNAALSFSNGASGIFGLAGSSSSPSAAINPFSSSNNGASNPFGSSLQAPQSSIFGSSPATGFSFGASSTPSSQTNAAPAFPFNSAPASVFSAQSPAPPQPVFGNPPPSFPASSPATSYQMTGEDSMAEDPMQSNSPSAPAFGQPNISPPSAFMFGSSAPPQPNPFQFGGQQNQGLPQNQPMFQATGSADFNPGGSFSLGSGGGDKSSRRYVKPNRSKNRKK